MKKLVAPFMTPPLAFPSSLDLARTQCPVLILMYFLYDTVVELQSSYRLKELIRFTKNVYLV
jgi:hypothetical protein